MTTTHRPKCETCGQMMTKGQVPLTSEGRKRVWKCRKCGRGRTLPLTPGDCPGVRAGRKASYVDYTTRPQCPKCGIQHAKKSGIYFTKTDRGVAWRCGACGFQFHEKTTSLESMPPQPAPVPAADNPAAPTFTLTRSADRIAVDVLLNHSIKTLDELLEICEVDATEWVVESYTINKWDTAAKTDEGMQVTPLYQVKARLIRRNDPFAGIDPPEIPALSERPHLRSHVAALLVPDMHIGFKRDWGSGTMTPTHDVAAIESVVAFAKHLQPERVVFLGDNLDNCEFSDKYFVDPQFRFVFQPSIKALQGILRAFRDACPHAQMDYLEGNHEERLRKAVAKQLPALYDEPGLFLQERLGMKSLNIEYHGNYPLGMVWLPDGVAVVHGKPVRSGSGVSAHAALQHYGHSVLMGHVHRLETATLTRYNPDGSARYLTATSCGTLATLDGSVPSANGRENWQQGCAVLLSGSLWPALCPFVNGKLRTAWGVFG